jgi:hypothetical protein
MGEDITPEASSPRKVYEYGPGRASLWLPRIIVGVCVLIAVGYGYVWYIGHFQRGLLILVAAVWLLLAVWQSAVLYLLSRARLITSPEGLEYFTLAYSIRTTWDNIEKIEVRPPLSQEVLYLRQEPAVHSSSPLRWLWLRPWSNRKLVPLHLFHRSWQGELGGDFRRYAPHLFST